MTDGNQTVPSPISSGLNFEQTFVYNKCKHLFGWWSACTNM